VPGRHRPAPAPAFVAAALVAARSAHPHADGGSSSADAHDGLVGATARNADATTAPPTAPPDTPTPITVTDPEPFVPDLGGVISAAFSFSRVSSGLHIVGTGQMIWPEQSVYEVGEELYLASEGQLLIWSVEGDGWVEVLPSARLHDNLVYWLRLLPLVSPTDAELDEEGMVRVMFSVDVPSDQNVFGVRDLRGSGWFAWDPATDTLHAVAYDLIYLDRLGTSNNDMLYMEFETWNEPVVIPER
jgi:hypothetical protein